MRRVSQASIQQVKALRAAGATMREIAQITGLSMTAINRRLNPYPEGVWRPQRKKTTPRACLCCGRTFDSFGPMNRLCKRCREQSVSPFDVPHLIVSSR